MIDFIKRVSAFGFATTVTEVAIIEWLVKGGSIPAFFAYQIKLSISNMLAFASFWR